MNIKALSGFLQTSRWFSIYPGVSPSIKYGNDLYTRLWRTLIIHEPRLPPKTTSFIYLKLMNLTGEWWIRVSAFVLVIHSILFLFLFILLYYFIFVCYSYNISVGEYMNTQWVMGVAVLYSRNIIAFHTSLVHDIFLMQYLWCTTSTSLVVRGTHIIFTLKNVCFIKLKGTTDGNR